MREGRSATISPDLGFRDDSEFWRKKSFFSQVGFYLSKQVDAFHVKKMHVDANTGAILQSSIVYEMRDLLTCKMVSYY